MRSVKICIVDTDEDKARTTVLPKPATWKDTTLAACSQIIFWSSSEVLHALHAGLCTAAHPEKLMMLYTVGSSLDTAFYLDGGAGWAGQGGGGAG